jgi:hypothetical protein
LADVQSGIGFFEQEFLPARLAAIRRQSDDGTFLGK